MPRKPARPIYETPNVLHDAPMQNGQTEFHFDDYAATLARLIADKTTETPLTIGVSGTWGAGKTTLLRRVQSMLEPTHFLSDPTKAPTLDFCNPDEKPQSTFRACRTVWFNAWKYADEEQLLVALVRVIVQTMADDGMVNEVIGKLLDPAYPRRDVVATVLSWFSLKLPKDIGLQLNTGAPKETRFGEKTATLDLFDEAFDRLLAAWVHQTPDYHKIDPKKGVLVVIIDDLDRCLPAKTVQVLEAVKLFLDKKGCIFLLGADTEVVRAAVQSHYENAKVKDENADKYLEKVIQLRFELPPIAAGNMQAYLKDQSRVDAAMQEQWETLIAAAEINPRRVKAVINAVNLLWAMFKNSDPRAASVERADFIRWQAIGQAAPDDFRKRAHDLDAELRFDFVRDALRWAKGQGDETINALFRDYDKYSRLKRALREVEFGPNFDPAALDAFIYLIAPLEKKEPEKPKPEPAPEKPVESLPVEEMESAERFTFSTEPEPVLEESKGVMRDGGSTIPGKSIRAPEKSSREGSIVVGDMEFMRVPAGRFVMGSKEDDKDAVDGEKPQHTIEIPYDYFLGRFTVTNAQFEKFIRYGDYKTTAEQLGFATGYIDGKWEDIEGANWQHPCGPNSDIQDRLDHPVVSVSCLDALEYVKLLNTNLGSPQPGLVFRLPTEAEWEKAARGAYGNIYPWGNDFDPKRLHFAENSNMDTAPVGAYPNGASPYGCEQMSGNIWEWTNSLLKGYPYKVDDGREGEKELSRGHVVRGGSFGSYRLVARAAVRLQELPNSRRTALGFRIALAPPLK